MYNFLKYYITELAGNEREGRSISTECYHASQREE